MNAQWGKDPLSPKLRSLAASGHPRADELLKAAEEMDAKEVGYFADPQTVPVASMLGAWARAKRLWSECSGEPLVPKAIIDTSVRLAEVLGVFGEKK